MPFGNEEAFLETAIEAAREGRLPEIREEARRSARKVRWKKVVKRFERHLRDLIQREYPDREVEDLDPIDEIEPVESA